MKIDEIKNEGTKAKIQGFIAFYEAKREDLATRQFARIMNEFDKFLELRKKSIEANGVSNCQNRRIRFSTPLLEGEEYILLPEVVKKLEECGLKVEISEVIANIEW